jgi:NADH dehydrogenase [ubiquinone] 1 alpha subcomplex assembly factor 6
MWWQEGIDKMFANKLIKQSITHALSHTIVETKISKTWLKVSTLNDLLKHISTIQEDRLSKFHNLWKKKPIKL